MGQAVADVWAPPGSERGKGEAAGGAGGLNWAAGPAG
jgi:hypothetical protein